MILKCTFELFCYCYPRECFPFAKVLEISGSELTSTRLNAKPRSASFGNIQEEFLENPKKIELMKCTEMIQSHVYLN